MKIIKSIKKNITIPDETLKDLTKEAKQPPVEITKLISLIVDQDIEGLHTFEKQTAETVVTLNNTLKSLHITLATLEECGLKDCEEFGLTSDRYNDYYEKLQDNTKFLLIIRKAITMLEEELNT